MEEHPVDQPILTVVVNNHLRMMVGSVTALVGYAVTVTRIEACTKSGMHANIPYVRVWAGDDCIAEFCQHQITGVFFGRKEQADG